MGSGQIPERGVPMGLMKKILDMLPGEKTRHAKAAQHEADLKIANERAKKVLG